MIVIDPLQQTDTINTSQKLRIRFKWTYFKGVLAGIRLFRHFIALLVYEDISISMKNWNCLFVAPIMTKIYVFFCTLSIKISDWRVTGNTFAVICLIVCHFIPALFSPPGLHLFSPLNCTYSAPQRALFSPRIRHFLSPSIPSIPQ